PSRPWSASSTARSASGGGSVAEPDLMAEPGNSDGLRDLAEQVVLAAVGAVSLTAERVDSLADDLAERGGMRRDDARALARDLASRWRGDSIRVSERAGSSIQGALKQFGLALREEVE